MYKVTKRYFKNNKEMPDQVRHDVWKTPGMSENESVHENSPKRGWKHLETAAGHKLTQKRGRKPVETAAGHEYDLKRARKRS